MLWYIKIGTVFSLVALQDALQRMRQVQRGKAVAS